MRAIGIAAAVVALVALAFWLARSDNKDTSGTDEGAFVPEPDTAAHWLVGRVTGAEPLDGVEVRAVWPGGASAVSTDREGRYRIPASNLRGARSIRLRADAPDGRVAAAFATVKQDQTIHDQADLRLGGSGEVVFRTSPAAAGVEIRVRWHPEGGDPIPVATGFTDAQGALRLRLPLGRCSAETQAGGYEPAGAEVEVVEQETAVTLPLTARD